MKRSQRALWAMVLCLVLAVSIWACGGGGSSDNNNNGGGGTTTDTSAPTIPVNLTATASLSNQIDLSWTASTDNTAVMGYNIYRGGTEITTSLSVKHSDTGLTAGRQYCYTVAAYDAAGNVSAQSEQKCATTITATADSAPTTPLNVNATTVSSSQINISWSASSDDIGVARYDIYYNNAKIGNTTATTTSYNISGLTANTEYCYYIIASDAAGNLSNKSSEACASTNYCENLISDYVWPENRYRVDAFTTPPAGYTAIIGWATAMLGKGETHGKVTFKNLQLWERYGGQDTVVASDIVCEDCDNSADRVSSVVLNKEDYRDSSAWAYTTGAGDYFTVTSEGYVVAPVEQNPELVYFFWHTTWPRTSVKENAYYYITSDVIIENGGIAMVGFDYYTAPDSTGSSKLGANSNWACYSEGGASQTMKAGAE